MVDWTGVTQMMKGKVAQGRMAGLLETVCEKLGRTEAGHKSRSECVS